MAPVPSAAHLFSAVTTGNLQEVMRMLKLGTDVNGPDLHGRTPLHYAADCGKSQIAQLLLSRGANVNPPADKSGLTPLHYACCNGRKGTAELLIRFGADLAAATEYGWTPMHFASAGGHKDICQMLLDAGYTIFAPVGRKAKETHVSCITISRTKDLQEFLRENVVVPMKIAEPPRRLAPSLSQGSTCPLSEVRSYAPSSAASVVSLE